MELLLGFICILFVVTVVGHGIWVLIAAMLGGRSIPASPQRPRQRAHERCPNCSAPLESTDYFCQECDLDLYSRLARQLHRIRTTERGIRHLLDEKKLDTEIADRVLAALDRSVKDLLAPASHTAPEPEPIAVTESLPIARPVTPDLSPVEQLPEFPSLDTPAVAEPEDRRGVLAAFMEERNILWGELVGGLLIVGCSIALVLTLWRSLEAIPYFPFLLATGITVALFGAGQYTLHHWRLTSTSRGLLVISMLLTPLNLLLLANPGGEVVSGWFDTGLKGIAVLIFVGIVRAAGRDLIGVDLLPGPVDRRWLLALSIVGAPATQTISAFELLWLPIWLPLACSVIACGALVAGLTYYRGQDRNAPLAPNQGIAVLMFTGLSIFAILATWTSVAVRQAVLPVVLMRLAIPLAMLAFVVTEVGLLVHRRTSGNIGIRATGTGLACLGMVFHLVALTLAWPNPALLTPIAVIIGLVFTREAWRNSAPWFQVGAIPAFGLALIFATHGVLGSWIVPEGVTPAVWLKELLASTTSGEVFVGFALVLALVAEVVIRIGNRPQAIAYAFGGLFAGTIGLFLVSVRGPELPWHAVGVHTACALGLYAANLRWRRRVYAEAGFWLILLGTLWLLFAIVPTDRPIWVLTLSGEALALAALARLLVGKRDLLQQLREGAADVAVAAGIVAIVLMLIAPTLPDDHRFAFGLFTLAVASLLLSRVFASSVPTWIGSVIALLGLTHLNLVTLELKPTTAGLIVALLGHATVTIFLAALRRRRSRVRLFGEPLRRSGYISTVLSVPFLLFPLAGHLPIWVGFAIWLAALWFVVAWRWHERGAFASGQAALLLAVVIGAFEWIVRQDWWATTPAGFGDPRVFQTVGIGLGVLSLAWVGFRRISANNQRLYQLWHGDPLAFDRCTMGVGIVALFALLWLAVLPNAAHELTPRGEQVSLTVLPEFDRMFSGTTWLVIGVFCAIVTLNLRFNRQPDEHHDAPLLGLTLLVCCLPLAVAGLFAPELATASALRWGISVLFVLGILALAGREWLARTVARAGFSLQLSEHARTTGYAICVVAAVLVLLFTIWFAILGFRGQVPMGPLAESIFARMGVTPSAMVPLVLVIVGMAIGAVRERSDRFAFAGGLVFIATVAGGYALGVVTRGGTLGAEEWVRLGVLAVGSAAAWSLAWQFATQRVPDGPLLTIQTLLAPFGIALLTPQPLVRLFLQPTQPLPTEFAALGQIGWVALTLAGWSCFRYSAQRWPVGREHVIGTLVVVAGVFAACTVQRWNSPGQSVSFYTMAAVWAVGGLSLIATHRGPWVTVLASAVSASALLGPSWGEYRWILPLVLAGYSLVSAGIVRRNPVRFEGILGGQAVLGVAVTALAVAIAISPLGIPERFAGSLTLVVLALSLGLLEQRLWSLVALSGSAVLTAWAVPNPGTTAIWLHRDAWTFVALVATTIVGLVLLQKLRVPDSWKFSARQVASGLFPLSLVGLVIFLFQQVLVFDPVTKRTPLNLPEVLAALAAIGVLIVLSFRFALRPQDDPYHVAEHRRSGYVYLAEVLLVLFFVHVRFNIPELFLGQAVRYWTFIVMLMGFIGVGLAELFERRAIPVLAIPMRRTGVALPLIPLLAFWAKPPSALLEFADRQAPGIRPFLGYLEKLPQHFDSYASLWFLAGTLYAIVALSKRTFGWSLLSALAVNAGMWSLLAYTGISAAVHPQVWVIPLALIILVSEHVNRRELPAGIASGLRYLGIGMVYVSSVSDLFIAGVGETWWLPLVLAVFCILGMAAGIGLRVRAFLFLGAGFLVIDIFAIIWHAAVDRSQTWIWYATGILLGVAILAIFALFEKRRKDVLEIMDRIRHWD